MGTPAAQYHYTILAFSFCYFLLILILIGAVWRIVDSVNSKGASTQSDEEVVAVCEDGFDAGFVALLELDYWLSCEC